MADQPATVQVSGLQPHERVEIGAELVDGAGERWTSGAEFEADASGHIDSGSQSPLRGSYKRASAMGLVWSMLPVLHGTRAYERPLDNDAQTITFHLVRAGQVIGQANLTQVFRAPGVRQIRLHGALDGSFYLPAGRGPWPGVLVLGGPEGGVPESKALWLASHGYAALALAYFQHEDLPNQLERIPLEYFGKALAWLHQRPEVNPEELAVMGTSRGGELALQLGSMYPQIRAVVAYAPASVRYPSCCGRWMTAAWTFGEVELPYASPPGPGRLRNLMIDEAAEIAVERTHGPIMVISGGEDAVWPSSFMTEEVIGRLDRWQFPYRFERLDYPRAGHWAGSPDIVPAWTGELVARPTGEPVMPGGRLAANAESGIDAGPKVLGFLGEALHSGKRYPVREASLVTGQAAQ